MGSATGGDRQQPSNSKSLKRPRDPSNPNPSRLWIAVAPAPPLPEPSSPPAAAVAVAADDDESALDGAEFLSREEVIRRRLRHVKELKRHYEDQLWTLVEEVRVKHRDYYWEFGKSPMEDGDEEEEEGGGGGGGEANGNGGGIHGNGELGFGEKERKRCALSGCKTKAMPLTSYCHGHILSDPKQTLYKACSYVIKSSTQSRPIICGKPLLRAAMPSLCPVHFQKAQRHITQALRKAGMSLSTSSKPTPKLHLLIAESVQQIQTKRRKALNATIERNADENGEVP